MTQAAVAITETVVAVDEELWFGSPGEDKELEDRAAQSMAAVAARVLGAKPFPAAARRLEELTRSGGAKIEQVVGVLESDPGLSMRLLRLVNSAGYALRVRCTSVRHAAALVGMRRLHQLATTAAVLDLFENSNPAIKHLLSHAAVVGAFCRYLAVHVDLAPDELFTCGFLHDIGKLMLIDAEGASYLELVEKAGESPDALHRLEQETYGFDHAVLGAHVLKNWRIPNPVPRVVAWHHNVARAYQADPAIAAMVQSLRLADQLSYLVRTHPELEGIQVAAASPAATYLGVSEAQLSSMWADLARLSERITAPAGATDTAELIPREESVRPSMRTKGKKSKLPKNASLAPVSIRPTSGPVSEMPKHFVCVVCSKASFGNRCPVCSGHVCSKHQVGAEQWCSDCAAAYSLDVGSNGFPLWERLTAAGIVVGAGLLSLIVAVLAGRPIVGALVGSVMLSSLCVLLVLVGRRFWLKRAFLRARAQSEAGDDAVLPLGLSMPPEPNIAMLSDSPAFTDAPIAMRPTEHISAASSSHGLPALFSVRPTEIGLGHAMRPESVPPAEPIPAPPSVPRNLSDLVSPHNAVAHASTPTAPVPARAAVAAAASLSVVPETVQSAAPPAVEPGPPTRVDAPSELPDAPGWRPVERTEPALPTSKGPPTDLHRMVETLPTAPPVPAASPEPAPPSEPPVHTTVSSPAAPLLSARPVESSAVVAAPVVAETVPVAPPEPLTPPEPAAMAESSVEPSRTTESPAAPSRASEEVMTPLPSEASLDSPATPSLPSPAFIAAACKAVPPTSLVACRPASLRPTHYACSPATGR